MKHWMTLLAAALAIALAAPARAGGPVIDWDPAYFWSLGEPAPTPTNLPAGSVLQAVGTVSTFGPPLAFLNATMPTIEYTFFCDSLLSLGTATIGPPATQIYRTFYTGGTIKVYSDPTPDAAFDPFPPNANVPSTFTDLAPPILTGNFTSFVVTTNNFTVFKVGNLEGNIEWTGGTLINYFLGGNNQLCPGLLTGGATWNTAPGIGIPGYLFRHDGKIDLPCPVPTKQSTWGQLKQLYR